MSLIHQHELAATVPDGAVADALAEVAAGEIAYLTRSGQPIAALVPVTELAELQQAADVAALAEAREISARPGPLIPHDLVEAMMDADDASHDAMAAALDSYAGTDLTPVEVTALWERVRSDR